MKVIIIGAGQVGHQVAKYLTLEGVEVVIIDKDENKLRELVEELDVAVVHGEGGDPQVLKAAEADTADLLLAVTNSDETNMIACLLAKAMFNIKRRIARIRNPEYFFNKVLLSKEYLDIDPAINPELEVAHAIVRLLEIPFASEVIEFEKGKILILAYKIPSKSFLIGEKLRDLSSYFRNRFIIGLIVRDEQVIVPRGDNHLEEGDLIYVPVLRDNIEEVARILGVSEIVTKNVMIMGGGRVGYYVASFIEDKMRVKIIEKKPERCQFLSQHLKRSLILCGDGTDKELLLQENIKDMDAFVAVSDSEELNIMACLLAKRLGVKRVIAIVNKSEYLPLAHHLGIESVLNPRLLTASLILRYIRKGEILSLTAIADHKAEIMEIELNYRSSLINKTLEEIKFPKDSLVGIIKRGEEIIIPKGKDVLQAKDRIIMFVLSRAIKDLEKLLK